MSKFIKKAAPVEAVLFDGTEFGEYTYFIPRELCRFSTITVEPCLFICKRGDTLFNLNLRADKGDWIVKDADGQFYTVKPAIFAANYEAVPEAE